MSHQLWAQWLLALLSLFVSAAAALPLIAALGLLFGRRGNGTFCLYGTGLLLRLNLCFSVAGVLFYPGSYLIQMLAFSSPEQSLWGPFFSLAGAPWSASLAAWLAGLGLLFLVARSLPQNLAGAAYSLRFIRLPLILCLAAAFCFFAAFVLISWSFAGLPQGLTLERAAFAILRNAARHYFMAFSAAGAFALAFAAINLPRLLPVATPAQMAGAWRWLAIWAAIGYLPGLLQNWAIAVGLGYRGALASHLGAGLMAQIGGMALLTGAIITWAIAAFSHRPRPLLAWLGLVLLLLKESWPFILQIFVMGV